MNSGIDLSLVQDFGTALLIGALIGIEREKRKTTEKEVDIGGLRTFIIIALIGAIAGWLVDILDMPWVLVAALLAVTMPVVAGYVVTARAKPSSLGITTESAAIAVFLLGAMSTLGYRGPAVALGIVTTAVLAYKQPLHGIVDRIGWDDIYAGVRLLIATFIVLPLLPNRTIDPWDALNPYSLWLLVLLISGLSLVGYVVTRWFGTDKGTVLTGLTGGLVSSTAVTLSFARQSREDSRTATAYALACGMLLAWCIMFGRVIALVLIVNPALLGRIVVPFIAMGLAAAIAAWLFFRRGAALKSTSAAKVPDVPFKNPFSLTQASKFAALFAVVLLIVKLVQDYWPGRGLYMVAAVAGLPDVDAITLSMADYAKTGDPEVAVNAIIVASLTNTLVKCGMATALGGHALRRPILIASSAIVVSGLAMLGWRALLA
jgi:uncharacterized membrane protein (DUF4010 family)